MCVRNGGGTGQMADSEEEVSPSGQGCALSHGNGGEGISGVPAARGLGGVLFGWFFFFFFEKIKELKRPGLCFPLRERNPGSSTRRLQVLITLECA